MSDETTLLSCPFCEGETELKEYKPNVSGIAICRECGARSPICKNDHTGGWRPKAIAAWNTRAELGSGTCEDVGPAAVFKCSKCGWFSPVFTFGEGMPRFCPQCGKVVER